MNLWEIGELIEEARHAFYAGREAGTIDESHKEIGKALCEVQAYLLLHIDKAKMTKTTTGARIHFCGHDASFIADILEGDGVAVVIAGDGTTYGIEAFEESLTRPAGKCQFHLFDNNAIYWGKHRGVFVVPLDQLEDLRDEGRPLPQQDTGDAC